MFSAIRGILFCVVLITCVSTSAAQTVTPVKSKDLARAALRVKQIIAHRGASIERPECTLAAIRRAIEVGATAVEVDIRTSLDGQLFILHDASLDRTTNGKGPANALVLKQLQALDAGSWHGPAYRGERIPSLIEAAQLCRGKIDLLLDLKEQGETYDRRVVDVINQYGDPQRTIVGVRSVAQAKRFRSRLPRTRQLALIPSVESIEAFAEAGVDDIRLWPRWLQTSKDAAARVRATCKRLHLNGTRGELEETLQLLAFEPDSLSSDDPLKLTKNLKRIAANDLPGERLAKLLRVSGTKIAYGESAVGAKSFLNRDYEMLELPAELAGLPRIAFDGGQGDQLEIEFLRSTVIFAALAYNDSGSWSFGDGGKPAEHGWHPWPKQKYRGASNPEKDGKPHYAAIWFREFKANQSLEGMPPWWLCLGIVELEAAQRIRGFKAGMTSNSKRAIRQLSHQHQAAQIRPLHVPRIESAEEFAIWRDQKRKQFVQKFLYPYARSHQVLPGSVTNQNGLQRREFHVAIDGQRLFRYFRLAKEPGPKSQSLPAIVCFMGHGKVEQILSEPKSYQHACAAEFAQAGYVVFAMENIGMEPHRDDHLDIDRALRLEGKGWYHVLFAHQRILIDQVFRDSAVDHKRVGAAGVSTGGLLALTAAVIEPRIAATSVQGIFGSMRVSFIRDRRRHCSCGAIPGLLPEFDLPELALLVAPRHLQICHGETDGFSPAEGKRCLQLIGPYFDLAGVKRPSFHVAAGGHAFAVQPALEFFKMNLP